MKTIFKFALIIAITAITFTSCSNNGDNKAEDHQEGTSIDSTYTDDLAESATPCLCESNWFPHSQTSAPAEGKGSPFDVSSTTNCIFHQWSWQKFLWLTKPDGDTPLFLNQSKIYQVTDHMFPVPQQTGATVVLKDTEQAGSNGILKTNPAYNSASNQSSTVYYSIHISPEMRIAADSFLLELNSGALDSNNYNTFPVASLELKVSWVEISAIPSNKIDNYFTTTAALSTNGGASYTNTTMALLGMHVVGVVENHPEFIWATFEHNDMTPIYDWTNNSVSSSDEKLLFTAGTTSGLGAITYAKDPPHVTPPHQAYDLFKYGVPVNASGYLQTSQSEPANFNNISSINACVASNLKDVWNNYFYKGSLWLNTDGMSPTEQAHTIYDLGYAIAKVEPDSLPRGSVNNANVSMETYTQTFQHDISKIAVSNLTNCFSCHSSISFSNESNPPVSPIYISHIFDGYVQENRGKTKKEIDLMKDRQHAIRFPSKKE